MENTAFYVDNDDCKQKKASTWCNETFLNWYHPPRSAHFCSRCSATQNVEAFKLIRLSILLLQLAWNSWSSREWCKRFWYYLQCFPWNEGLEFVFLPEHSLGNRGSPLGGPLGYAICKTTWGPFALPGWWWQRSFTLSQTLWPVATIQKRAGTTLSCWKMSFACYNNRKLVMDGTDQFD